MLHFKKIAFALLLSYAPLIFSVDQKFTAALKQAQSPDIEKKEKALITIRIYLQEWTNPELAFSLEKIEAMIQLLPKNSAEDLWDFSDPICYQILSKLYYMISYHPFTFFRKELIDVGAHKILPPYKKQLEKLLRKLDRSNPENEEIIKHYEQCAYIATELHTETWKYQRGF